MDPKIQSHWTTVQYFTFIEGISMEINELVNIMNESKLLPYEIADAVSQHLRDYMDNNVAYCDTDQLERDAKTTQFYLSAIQLKGF